MRWWAPEDVVMVTRSDAKCLTPSVSRCLLFSFATSACFSFPSLPSSSYLTLTVAMTKVEGKRSAEVADAGGAQGQGAEKKAKVAVDGGDASAAPTPARLDALGVA